MEQNTIPDGYWEDARGCLIPVEQIKEIVSYLRGMSPLYEDYMRRTKEK